MARDRWAEWILSRRFGGDEAVAAATLEALRRRAARGRNAPNPNAPTFEAVLDAELDADERERFLAYLRPRYEAGAMSGRSAVAYLRARRSHGLSRNGG
jgi:hypothetical protein